MRLCRRCKLQNFTMIPIISKINLGHIDQGRLQSPTFGKEFKNEKDMNDYAKHIGAVHIGDEPIEKLVKRSEAIKAEQESYDPIMKEVLGGNYNA